MIDMVIYDCDYSPLGLRVESDYYCDKIHEYHKFITRVCIKLTFK